MTSRSLNIGPVRVRTAQLLLWLAGAATAAVLLTEYVDALHVAVQRGARLHQTQMGSGPSSSLSSSLSFSTF